MTGPGLRAALMPLINPKVRVEVIPDLLRAWAKEIK
jgi:hypothetical protein